MIPNQGDIPAHASSGRESEITTLRPILSDLGECKPEHQELLRQLLEIYKPKQRLVTKDRRLIKTILSLKQGYDGKKAKCVVCLAERESVEPMDIHHYDSTESHNELQNLGPADHTCNSALNGKKRESTRVALLEQSRLGSVSERERAAGAQGHTSERTITEESVWNAKEGQKHDIQRKAWNKWITDLVNGPFKGINTILRRSVLANKAPWGLARMLGLDEPLGSSVTYRRFITEDIEGGILGLSEDEFGKPIVYLIYQPKVSGN